MFLFFFLLPEFLWELLVIPTFTRAFVLVSASREANKAGSEEYVGGQTLYCSKSILTTININLENVNGSRQEMRLKMVTICSQQAGLRLCLIHYLDVCLCLCFISSKLQYILQKVGRFIIAFPYMQMHCVCSLLPHSPILISTALGVSLLSQTFLVLTGFCREEACYLLYEVLCPFLKMSFPSILILCFSSDLHYLGGVGRTPGLQPGQDQASASVDMQLEWKVHRNL